MRDIHTRVDIAQALASQLVTGAVNGASVDLNGFDAAELILNVGTATGTTPTATLKLQESDDGTTFTDVAAANIIGGALPTIDTNVNGTTLKRGYAGAKRYIRVIVSAVGGTTPSIPLSASIIRGFGRKKF